MAKRKHSVLLRLTVVAFCVYMVYSLFSLQSLLVDKIKERGSDINTRDVLKYEIDELENLLLNGDDSELIEKAARERLGYSYSNEQIFQDSNR